MALFVDRMRLHRIILGLLAAGCSLPSHAVGLGSLSVVSGLGQSFSATVSLLGQDSADVESKCAFARVETVDGALIDHAKLRVQNGLLHIRTVGAISEPAIRLAVGVQCGKAVLRSYEVLLDPPSMETPRTVAVSGGLNDVVRTEAVGDPAVETEGLMPSRSVEPGQRHKPEPALKPAKATRAPASTKQLPAEKPGGLPGHKSARAVLKLAADTEPLPADVMRKYGQEPAAFPTATPLGAPMQAAGNAPDALLSREAELRAQIELVRTKLALAEASLALSRMQAVPSAPVAPPSATPENRWIELMAALLAGSIGFSAWMVLRDRRRGATVRKPYGQAGASQTAESAYNGEPATTSGRKGSSFARFSLVSRFNRPPPETRWIIREPKRVRQTDTSPPAEGLPNASDDRPVGETLVEAERDRIDFDAQHSTYSFTLVEITDVIQQVEFWISIGKVRQAISILDPLAKQARPESPIGWLYLLDLYSAVGEREEYDKLAIRFKSVFNARIPGWDERHTATAMRSLDDFPQLMSRICAEWDDSDKVIALLEELLVDGRTGQRNGFDLPAYRDIMLLISIASERLVAA